MMNFEEAQLLTKLTKIYQTRIHMDVMLQLPRKKIILYINAQRGEGKGESVITKEFLVSPRIRQTLK